MFWLLLAACASDDSAPDAPAETAVVDSAQAIDTATEPEPDPRVEVSTREHDFGAVYVGCESELEIAVSNVGGGALTIQDLALSGDAAFSLEGPGLPWALAAGETAELALLFAPGDEADASTALTIVTDDPAEPEVTVQASGAGGVMGAFTERSEVRGPQPVAALFAVNEVATTGSMAPRLTASLPLFFETLLQSGAPFRVAGTADLDGQPAGDVAWIDETSTAEQASEIFLTMVSGGSGDNDQPFNTLTEMIAQGEGWLAETETWAGARLSLVTITNDVEQSGGGYQSFLEQWAALRPDGELVAHGIAGDVPYGCEAAVPCTAVYDASAATGGVFLSVCEPDWDEHMTALALAALGEGGLVFYTDFTAVPESVEVSVDGAAQSAGWRFDEVLGAVVFEAGSAPPVGAEVSISYVVAGDCG